MKTNWRTKQREHLDTINPLLSSKLSGIVAAVDTIFLLKLKPVRKRWALISVSFNKYISSFHTAEDHAESCKSKIIVEDSWGLPGHQSRVESLLTVVLSCLLLIA